MQSKLYPVITDASLSKATQWLLTSSGVFVDTQTITIGGVVFTTVTALTGGGGVAGEVLLGVDAAATLTNLTAALNAPGTTTSTFTALSVDNAYKIKSLYGISATTTATVMTMVSSTKANIVVSETETNAAWTTQTLTTGIPTNTMGKISLQFTCASHTSGNGVFTVEVSNDNTNWVVYNRLTTNATNTNAQTDTRVASITLNTNTSSVVTIPETDVFAAMRVRLVVTTDGVYNCTALTL